MQKIYKIEVFLPKKALKNIRMALYELGLGKIGNYDCCLSWQKVRSSWRPLNGAKPFMGKIGKIEFAAEYKLEFRCSEKELAQAVKAIKENHPYEEVCINVLPLVEVDNNKLDFAAKI